jgi:hypothetical protein
MFRIELRFYAALYTDASAVHADLQTGTRDCQLIDRKGTRLYVSIHLNDVA